MYSELVTHLSVYSDIKTLLKVAKQRYSSGVAKQHYLPIKCKGEFP